MNKIYYEKPQKPQVQKTNSENVFYERPQKTRGQNDKSVTMENVDMHEGNGQYTYTDQELEANYYQPSYQKQDYDEGRILSMKVTDVKKLIVDGIMVMLSIFLVINLFVAFVSLGDMNLSYDATSNSFWYWMEDGRYTEMVQRTWWNRFEGVKETEEYEQCYAVAEYFEAASLYKVAEYKKDVEKQEKYSKIMEEKLAYLHDIMYIAEDINNKLGIEQK